jgi:CRP/FNR family transcriptional regulator, cyclic AMP receptor protein
MVSGIIGAMLAHMLRRVEHFRELSLAEIETIIASGSVREYPEGSVLFHEDDPCAGLFVLLQGQVQLQKLGPDGKVAILRVLEPVIMFNEVAALDGGPNTTTAIAIRITSTWQIHSAGLQEIILQHPQLGLGMIKVLAAHNRYLVSQYQDLTMRPVLARCAKLIYELSDSGQKPILRRQHPNHQMAARVATVPELFSRSIKNLKETGAIHLTAQTIEVVDVARLAEIARIDPRA